MTVSIVSCMILMVLAVVLCIRCLIPFPNDYNYSCVGYPYGITLKHITRTNHHGWCIKYSVNFTKLLNPDECHFKEHLQYQTKTYKHYEDAYNMSKSMHLQNVIKIYPTETRDLLNFLSFLISIMLFFCLIISCVHYQYPYSTERHHLLTY